jgi:hypothetical protein
LTTPDSIDPVDRIMCVAVRNGARPFGQSV